MPRRVLLLLPQFPLDPASGAVRSLHSMCRLLAERGWPLAALGTTSTDRRDGRLDPLEHIAALGVRRVTHTDREHALTRFDAFGIQHTVLHTPGCRQYDWARTPALADAFHRLFLEHLHRFRPDILFTFGSRAAERERQMIARRRGIVVLFGLCNHSYGDPRAFEQVDAVTTPSAFLTRRYTERIGLVSTPLFHAIDHTETIADRRDPRDTTFINPIPDKGLYFMIRLADELAERRPDIPLRVVELRGLEHTLHTAARHHRIDLARHPSITTQPSVSRPAEIYATTRVLLVPSAWEEPAGRVVPEALLNGIPPIVSDRGGLAEMGNGGAIVRPLPAGFNEKTHIPPPPRAVGAWIDEIERLYDDQAYYGACVARARLASTIADRARLADEYEHYFGSLRPRTGPIIVNA